MSRLLALLGRCWQRRQAGGAPDSTGSTDKRRGTFLPPPHPTTGSPTSILPPAASGSSGAGLRPAGAEPARGARTLVVDFDGTITEQDLLDEIAQTFGDPVAYEEADEGLDERTMTLHEVLEHEFKPVRAPLEEVVAWVVEHARIRPGFRELVALARARGWRLVIVSSGFRELIEPILAREGLEGVELVSNRVDPDPSGWRVRFRDEERCETCGEACKRATVAALARGGEVIYVGDGYSDRCAAEASDRVFARRGLASHLERRGIPFEPFDDFFQIVNRIVTAPS